MAISVECPYCHKRMSAVDEAAGKKVACIGCTKPITVPGAAAQPVGPLTARPAERPVAKRPPPLPRAGPSFPAPATAVAAFPAAAVPLRAEPVPEFEGEAPEITMSLDGTSTLQTPDRRFRMRVDLLDVHPADRGPLFETIRERVWKILRAGPAITAQADLCVTCSEYDLGSQLARYMTSGIAGAVRTGLTLTGTINGKTINEMYVATRRFGFIGGSSTDMAAGCLTECGVKALSAIFQAAGVPETDFARAWRWIGIIKWAAAGTVLVLLLALAFSTTPTVAKRIPDPTIGRTRMICGAILAALGTYVIIAMGAMLGAPRHFLETDPRGVRAMARVGMQNIPGMRIATFLMGAVGVALIWFAILLYRNS